MTSELVLAAAVARSTGIDRNAPRCSVNLRKVVADMLRPVSPA
jgi:hypothetical protein